MKWTDETPTMCGYYWMLPRGDIMPIIIEVYDAGVLYNMKPGELLGFYYCGDETPERVSNLLPGTQFYGPLSAPKQEWQTND